MLLLLALSFLLSGMLSIELKVWHTLSNWKAYLDFCAVSSVAQSCPTLREPVDRSMPGFPVHHQLPELAQTHVHQVSDAIKVFLAI